MRLASCRVALPLYLGKALRHLLAQSRLCHTILLVATALAVPTPNRCLLHHQLQTVLRTDLMSLRLQMEPIQSVRRGGNRKLTRSLADCLCLRKAGSFVVMLGCGCPSSRFSCYKKSPIGTVAPSPLRWLLSVLCNSCRQSEMGLSR